ncbi:G2/mitotic-specific cyclin S13-7-like isoform X1 [Carex littledalei]|uniref:G2/mitotic-specific cyclin S13-7-like isoform X1 n=1 Tax=Carex littledalei TaxID=544730 RepID=A0A833VTZ7_9POAL|nr:G2/mitotic-specific cyclin S13-7-like isoform X1 [Carex littledalei]
MASRDQNVVVSQNQRERGGAVRVPAQVPKQQATGKYGDRKARPALDNISNLNPARQTLDGSFGAKLLANAQTATTVSGSKKSGTELAKEVRKLVNVEPATRKATCVTKPTPKQKQINNQAVQKRVEQRPIARKSNVAKAPPPPLPLPSHKQQGKKVMQNSRSDPSVGKVTVPVPVKPVMKPEYSRRREVHTLTSVLSARSKFACGINEKARKEAEIEDIDATDTNNQLAVVEYIEDIYKYYNQVEDTYRPHDYMIHQTDANPRRRAILLDWIVEVHNRFKLRPETLYLTVYIFDRYLSLEKLLVPKTELQLIGICAMLIASKYEEIWAPQVGDLIEISNNAYERDDILEKEKQVLNKLDWYLTVPTLYMFLVRFIKAARADKEMENMVYFIAELGLLEHSLIKFSPSMVAASCVYVARTILHKSPIWTPTLVHHTHYAAPQLSECAQILVTARLGAPHGKLKAVIKKYSHEEFGKVALHQSDVSPSSTSSTAYATCSSSCASSN